MNCKLLVIISHKINLNSDKFSIDLKIMNFDRIQEYIVGPTLVQGLHSTIMLCREALIGFMAFLGNKYLI